VRAYGELLAHRAARWPLLSSTLARLTPGMIVLALIYLLRDGGYSYTAVGAVTAAHQLGVGLGSPLQGRLVDRFGQRAVLVPDAVLYLAGTVALAALVPRGTSLPALVVVAVAAGVVFPPVTPCSRVLLSGLFPSGRLREAAFALSSIAVELGFILGPLVAVAVRAGMGAGAAVVAAGLLAAPGAAGYAATGAAAAVPRRDRSAPRVGALRSGGVRVMVLALGCIAVAFGILDVVVPAVAEFAGRPAAAGPLIASIASGSLLGGLVYGSRVWPGTAVTRLRVLTAGFTVGLLAIPLSLGSLPTFAVGLFVGGLLLGPTMICAFQLIDDLALTGTQTEAQAWTQAAVTFGVAAGASLAGAAVDTRGPAAAFVVGALCLGLGALVVNLRPRHLTRAVRGSDVACAPAPLDAAHLPAPFDAAHPAAPSERSSPTTPRGAAELLSRPRPANPPGT
jgi:MFS family permease